MPCKMSYTEMIVYFSCCIVFLSESIKLNILKRYINSFCKWKKGFSIFFLIIFFLYFPFGLFYNIYHNTYWVVLMLFNLSISKLIWWWNELNNFNKMNVPIMSLTELNLKLFYVLVTCKMNGMYFWFNNI